MTEKQQRIKNFTVNYDDKTTTTYSKVTGLSEITTEHGFPRITIIDNNTYININLNKVKSYSITMEDIA